MSSEAAAPAGPVDFIEAGAKAGAGASKGATVGTASGCGADAVLAGSVAASLWTDSRTARFTLISLMMPSCWSRHDVAAHKHTIIRACPLFKQFVHCTRGEVTSAQAQSTDRRPRCCCWSCEPAPSGRRNRAKQWRDREQT